MLYTHSMSILVTGAAGQIGSELVPALVNKFPKTNVIAQDIRFSEKLYPHQAEFDVLDLERLEDLIISKSVDTVYHLVSLLSVTGEKDPQKAWSLNVTSLKNVLDLALKHHLRVFWPSSIAAFGPTTPKVNTPQHTVLEPTTMYGVTKVTGELLCQYYFQKYAVDVRSVRYPGLISYKTPPGGGTTDYAVDIFYEGLKHHSYTCFVRPDTQLPMMYMDDAITATIQLMSAPADKLSVRTSYNIAGISFTAESLAQAINKTLPVTVTYAPDSRQKIADSWPQSVDDSAARTDWDWSPSYDLTKLVDTMIKELSAKLKLNP